MTEPKRNAAALVAARKLTIPEIAKQVGVSKRTVSLWKADPEFQAEVTLAANAWRGKARTKGAADRDARLRDLNDRYKRLRAVIQERARSEEMRNVPGGRTGLLCVQYRNLSHWEFYGEDRFWVTERVAEYKVDVGMLAEMREIEQHVATEMGEWNTKVVHSGQMDINVLMDRLNAGRKRVADEKVAREAAAKAGP